MTPKPRPPVPAQPRPLTLEQAALLQRIWRLYRFGLPDLDER